MGIEIDLLAKYPKAVRDIKKRAILKTSLDVETARKFDKDFFDGSRSTGYGGFYYNSKYWQPVIPDFIKFYQLSNSSKILDIGCAKGFMLHDFMKLLPGVSVAGIDISHYAIEHALDDVKPYLSQGNAKCLPYKDNEFDLVISINTLHNLELNELICALKEINRVGNGHSFITVDAYRNRIEKDFMYDWNLTAKTILHVDEWKSLFNKVGYKGDYYWFVP